MLVFPAHAGMSLTLTDGENGTVSFPRSRGDEPYSGKELAAGLKFSPLTRG